MSDSRADAVKCRLATAEQPEDEENGPCSTVRPSSRRVDVTQLWGVDVFETLVQALVADLLRHPPSP